MYYIRYKIFNLMAFVIVLFFVLVYGMLYRKDFQKSKFYFKQQFTGAVQWLMTFVFILILVLFFGWLMMNENGLE